MCPLCVEPYNDTGVATLPCLHPICKTCAERQNDKDEYECYFEREGVTCLSKYKKADVVVPTTAPASVHEMCSSCDENPATHRCQTCNIVLCTAEAQTHPIARQNRGHVVVPLPSAALLIENPCQTHCSVAASMYCQGCDRFVCYDCMRASHGGHSMHAVDAGLAARLQLIEDKMAALHVKSNALSLGPVSKGIKVLAVHQVESNSAIESAFNAVIVPFQHSLDAIKHRKDHLLEQVNASVGADIKTLEHQHDAIATFKHDVSAAEASFAAAHSSRQQGLVSARLAALEKVTVSDTPDFKETSHFHFDHPELTSLVSAVQAIDATKLGGVYRPSAVPSK